MNQNQNQMLFCYKLCVSTAGGYITHNATQLPVVESEIHLLCL